MIDLIWLLLFVTGVITAFFKGTMPKIAEGILAGAQSGVDLSLGLISIIVLWLGLMNIAEKAGAIHWLSIMLRPIAVYLFPSVPPEHPAMGAILANMSANVLGIGNAATPIGLRAMKELQSLNGDKETASDAMCTLLAVNTASITLIPTTVIAVRMQFSSVNPTLIVSTTLLATCIGTLAAIVFDRTFRRFAR